MRQYINKYFNCTRCGIRTTLKYGGILIVDGENQSVCSDCFSQVSERMSKKTWTPSEMGKKGGKASVNSRFKGKTKEEISEMMSGIRLAKKTKLSPNKLKKFNNSAKILVDNINREATRKD